MSIRNRKFGSHVMDQEAISPLSQHIWDLKYRLREPGGGVVDRSIADTWARVAKAAAEAERPGTRKRWAARFEDVMGEFAFLPAGRIIAGAGTGRQVTLFNCFVLDTIADDMASIFQNVKDAALTMQQGGGIGHDFSTLRPKGAPVRGVGADASGPVSFMDVWDAMCRTIMSAGQRRGAMMGTMRCDHPDIEEFIAAKGSPTRLRNFNLSVLVTDPFVAAVKADADWPLVFAGKTYRSVRARTLWQTIMRATYDYAEPGVIFIDRINAQNNLAYCETIAATNPCVVADTWVHTAAGPRMVADLVGKPFSARVDGKDFASGDAGFFSTGTKPVVRLVTDEGYSVRLTKDHRIERQVRATRWSAEFEWCAAGELRRGDSIRLADHRAAPDWPGARSEEEGYLLGLLIGDGTLLEDKAVLSVWLPAQTANGGPQPGTAGIEAVMTAAETAARSLSHRFDFAGWKSVAGRTEQRLSLASLRSLALELGLSPGNKAITPAVEKTSSSFHRGFLRGLFDADGSVQGNQTKGVSLRLSQSDRPRLQSVQRMLLRLGIASTIFDRRPAGMSTLPDGRGGHRSYPTQPLYELIISGENLRAFRERVGFADAAKLARMDSLTANYRRQLNREPFVATVCEVADDGVEDVFDVQIPGANRFDANGLSAHNCGEQPLPPNGACLLGSLNLARLIERPFTADAAIPTARLEELTAVAVRFLDNVIDVSRYPLKAQKKEAHDKRRIGLGITGLADALILSGLHYAGLEARTRAGQWMAAIQNASYLASAELAAERGTFPLYDRKALAERPGIGRLDKPAREAIARKGLRNGLLTSIAPTGTISLLADNVSSGIEPVFGFTFTRRVLGEAGVAREIAVEDHAHALFRERHGSHAALPDAFVTASDLAPAAHLQMQAALQPHVDSSISKTINCPEDIAFEAFSQIYMDAYDLGLKGCTTFRPNAVTGSVLTAGPAPGQTLPAPAPPAVPALHAGAPIARDPVLPGFTYKLRWPDSDHAMYVTLNDIVEGGVRRPFEIFINSKNLEHYAWTVALTRMISAVFRRGGDVTFVVEELKAVFDPRGGQWMDGHYVPSLLAAIGGIIEQHMIAIGFLGTGDTGGLGARVVTPPPPDPAALPQPHTVTGPAARTCPRCNQRAFVLQEGCWVCQSCGYSKCS